MKILTNSNVIKSYSELIEIPTYKGRFRYLKLDGRVAEETFGFDRYLNQKFYRSAEWRRIRDHIIARDLGCDLAYPGYEIHSRILIHHMNPITRKDILDVREEMLDPEYLVCVSDMTHRAIHYGDESLLFEPLIERTPGDTTPWKRTGGAIYGR